MDLDATKPVFEVADNARLKQVPQLQRLARSLKACSKFRYDTFQLVNIKCADQTVQMRRTVCVLVVGEPPKTDFLASMPKIKMFAFVPFTLRLYSFLKIYNFVK